jgi:hypothetical protein
MNNATQHRLINAHEPGWIDDMQEQIASQWKTSPDFHVFALLDCAFAEQCHARIKKHRLPARSLYDLSDDPSPQLQAVSPTLVQLTRDTIPAWREVLHLTDGWPMLSLIVTPESLDDMAQRLHPWCVVNADGQPFVFRFSDTRRLPCVVDVLSPEQHGTFFGPALAWRYRTRAAQWADLPLPAAAHLVADEVKLDADQCARLIGDAEADEVIAHLNLNDPALMQDQHPAAAHKLIAQGLKCADHYGIADFDRMHWCRLFVQQPLLEQMPQAIPLLAALWAKERNYADIENDLARLVHI